MNWLAYVLVLGVALAVDASLGLVLTLHGLGGIKPMFTVPVVVFAALFAHRSTACWAALAGGLLVDFSTPLLVAGRPPLYVPGPHALGFLFATLLILQLRAMVFRTRMLTMVVFSGVFVVAAGLVVVSLYVIRSYLPGEAAAYPMADTALRELLRRLGTGVYTAAIAAPMGWLLLWSLPLWDMPHATARGRGTR